ncbi:glycosyltransferase family 2 protein, partial [uncultured Georgenia sp.]|uniref:glycosyltransferase family 2 protein n=1 Tax=uncultured Georgenia sp. TaxID=378209 RepID=UPI00262201B8
MGGLRRLVRKVVRRKAAVPDPQTRRQQRIADAIRASGLFDAEWYREQLSAPLPPGTDPVEHYVTVGSTTDISPNPCFDTEWYRQSPLTPQRLDVAPFIHYVNRGAARNLPPHPMFDPEYYLEQHPEAAEHPGGALGHYLQEGWRTGALPSADFDLASYRRVYGQETAPPLADFIKRTRRLMEETRGWEHLPRTSESFDHAAAEEFKARVLTEYAALDEEPPLVTVVIPTKDRREGVLTAVRSVLDQTWTTWQLVIVDDGSTDGTAEALAPFLSDPRIELVRRERAGGVSVARNTGLARARGDYVAYLDSDNTWVPEFLEVMVAFMRTRGLRFGYAVSELVEEKEGGRRGYRALPFNREALRERNYIDCIV